MPSPRQRSANGQRTIDELGTPLVDVTFCVIDLETTGTDRGDDGITEVGAVKMRGGEVVGTFATYVNPGRAIPPAITMLTGISDLMVVNAPRIETVLPALQEFVGDAVIVGHNVGFDLGFLNAALRRSDREPFTGKVVDTLPLARRLLRPEVRDCRLSTLAHHLRLPHRPTHRALDDAFATVDLLHALLERSARLGVLGLDDLLELPTIASHAHAAKLPLTDSLPRSPGVYQFIGADGEVLYVGKATNLRQRVRSYFGNDDRRKVGQLLRCTTRIEVTVTADVAVAEVLELRLLHRLRPRYNKVGTTWSSYCYVRIDTDARWPRLSIVRSPHDTGVHLGPLSSRAAATQVIEAIHTALPIRRCSARPRRGDAHASRCQSALLGMSICPCSTDADEGEHWRAVGQAVAAITTDPDIVLGPLWSRVERLAIEQRYEEAALTRDRARAFTAAVNRQRQIDQLRSAGRLEVRLHDTVLTIADGVLTDARVEGQLVGLDHGGLLAPPEVPVVPAALPTDAADEVLCIARILERSASFGRVEFCSGVFAMPVQPVRAVDRLESRSPAVEPAAA